MPSHLSCGQGGGLDEIVFPYTSSIMVLHLSGRKGGVLPKQGGTIPEKTAHP